MASLDIEEGPVWPIQDAELTAIAYDSRYERCARLAHDGTISIRTIPGVVRVSRSAS